MHDTSDAKAPNDYDRANMQTAIENAKLAIHHLEWAMSKSENGDWGARAPRGGVAHMWAAHYSLAVSTMKVGQLLNHLDPEG